MRSRTWNTLQLGAGPDNSAWELFHENSKMGRYEDFPPSAQVVQRMQQLAESLEFRQRPAVALPSPPTLVDASLGDTIANRVTARRIEPCSLSLQDLAGILYYGY